MIKIRELKSYVYATNLLEQITGRNLVTKAEAKTVKPEVMKEALGFVGTKLEKATDLFAIDDETELILAYTDATVFLIGEDIETIIAVHEHVGSGVLSFIDVREGKDPGKAMWVHDNISAGFVDDIVDFILKGDDEVEDDDDDVEDDEETSAADAAKPADAPVADAAKPADVPAADAAPADAPAADADEPADADAPAADAAPADAPRPTEDESGAPRNLCDVIAEICIKLRAPK